MTGFLMTLSIFLHWLVSQSLFLFGGLSARPLHIWSPRGVVIIIAISSVMILGMTIHWFIPVRTRMPLMGGSAYAVLDASSYLQEPLPRDGIQWGDISTVSERIAGFGQSVGDLEDGAEYPSSK